MFEKNCYLDGIVDRSKIIKNWFIIFLLFLGVAFNVPSQCSFPKLKIHSKNYCAITFAGLCFYLHQVKKYIRFLKFSFTAWKVSKYRVFSVPYFPRFGLKFLGKYGPEITPYLDIFHVMFLTGDINIFVSRCVSSVLQFQIKSSFSSEETTCGRQAVKV